MKIQKKHWLIPAVAAAPILALITVILQSVSLFTEYEQGRGYFANSAPAHTAVTVILAVALVVFLAFAIVLRRELSTPSYAGTLSVLFSAGLSTVSLAVYAIFTVIAFTQTTGFVGTLMLLSALLACAAAVYFGCFLVPVSPQTTARGMLGLSFSFFCLMVALILYFDMSSQMNSPTKLLSLFAFSILACYALGECRGLFGRGAPLLQYLLTSFGLILSLTASVPNILYAILRGKELVLSIVYDFVLLAFGLYLLARLLQMLPRELPVTHPLIRVFLQDGEEEIETADAEDEETDEGEIVKEESGTEETEN
ncbi:MAG: hypothetical protein IJ009_06290 [Clostridia bacterium]|nr:hypothetical protein [Clostridia bacterium]